MKQQPDTEPITVNALVYADMDDIPARDFLVRVFRIITPEVADIVDDEDLFDAMMNLIEWGYIKVEIWEETNGMIRIRHRVLNPDQADIGRSTLH